MNLPENKFGALEKMSDEQLLYFANELNVWYDSVLDLLDKRGYEVRKDLHEKAALDVFGSLVKLRGGHVDELVAMSFEERNKAIDSIFAELDKKCRAEITVLFENAPEDPDEGETV